MSVKVRDSGIAGAGLGVFATRILRAGERVTRWHGTVVDHDISDQLYSQRRPDGKIVVGDPMDTRAGYCGQLVNDAHKVAGGSMQELRDSAIRYTERYADNNVHLTYEQRDQTLWIKTTRAIEEGEELFLYYGVKFWLAPKIRQCVQTRNLNDGIELENIYHSVLPLERLGKPAPQGGWQVPRRMFPPIIECRNGDLMVVSTGRRPNEDECRRALMWARVNPTVDNPYQILLECMQ